MYVDSPRTGLIAQTRQVFGMSESVARLVVVVLSSSVVVVRRCRRRHRLRRRRRRIGLPFAAVV